MEEISSLDSFHTDIGDGNDSLPRPESEPSKQDDADKTLDDENISKTPVEDEEADAAAPEADVEADEKKEDSGNSKTADDTAANEDDEFDQISDGTFDLDENSRATSAGPVATEEHTQDKENKDDDPANKQKESKKDNKEDKAKLVAEKSKGADESADFEEVDADVSANAAAAEEADMLGESDMTLPNPNEEAEDEVDKEKSPNAMDLDDVIEEAKSPADVEMGSPCDLFDSLKKAPNVEKTKSKQPSNDESMDVGDEEGDNQDAADVGDEEADSQDAADADDDGKDLVDADNEKTIAEENSSEAVDKDNTADTEVQQDITEVPDEEEPEEPEQEQEDEPVENVQEPEESDVCLIPDDTENEVTDADKEQAILARENAEKDDEQTQKDTSDKTKDQQEVEETENLNADAEAQATEAGAEATAMEVSEDTANTEAPDAADEPLLEEMQSGAPTGDVGSTAKIIIAWIVSSTQKCKQCNAKKPCGFRFKNPDTNEAEFLCEQQCCDELIASNQGKYFIRRKKFLVEELSNDSFATETGSDSANSSKTHKCLQCKEKKKCKYFFKQDEESFYVCNDVCFNLLSAEEPDKFKLKRHSIRVRNIGATTIVATEVPTKKTQPESRVIARTAIEAEAARLERVASFTRRCADCFTEVTLGDKNLLWETMDFCNEICLGKYQRNIGATCQTCNGDVPHQALGKYCVRFGFDIRQFCCASCLNEFKKGLKTCSCCQKDISSGNEGFLAPVGDKEQFKDFCSQACMRRYDAMCNPKKKVRNDICAVCNNDKQVRVEIVLDEKEHNFCSNPCFSAFKFVSNIVADQCGMCCKYFERKGNESFTIYTERRAKVFCTRVCLNVYIIVNRKIVSCQWCKVKKYNFDMIYKQQDAQEILMCSLNCLTLYGVSINAFSRTVAKCDNCSNSATPQYHLTMSDASMRNFCTYQCVMQFQSQFARAPLTLDSSDSTGQQQPSSHQQQSSAAAKNSAPFPTGLPKRVKLKGNQSSIQASPKIQVNQKLQVNPKLQVNQKLQIKLPMKNNSSAKKGPQVPVISTVSSLASGETETMIGNVTVRRSRGRGRKIDSPTPPPPPPQALPPVAQTSSSARVPRTRRNVDYTRSPSPVSLSPPPPPVLPSSTRVSSKRGAASSSTAAPALAPTPPPQIQIKEKITVQTETKIVTVPPLPPAVRNMQTSCKPQTVTVGFQCEPTMKTTASQTGKDYSNKVLIPVPVPIYIPQPMYMYSAPFPIPVPIPLPIPVPIFIPTTRNSAQGILKEIKKIQDKMPADPFEAELLMMAEMVAEEKRDSDSDSEDEIKPDPGVVSMQYDNNVQPVEVANNSYGEDVLQMALKMATGEYDQPTVDLESAMTTNTITNPPPGMVGHDDSMSHMSGHHMQQQQHHMMEAQRGGRGRKRGAGGGTPVAARNNRSPVKRQRLQELDSSPQPSSQPMQPVEKPDANMCLKYTFGVNAWKQWVMTKNADLEKSSIRRRPFKTELLQMTADELNYSLCLFVKEVRKPNGTEYAPDTIYYLVLGIQQYLYENGRIDNIFTDPYYERFTDCLDEVARKFSVLYNDSQYIVTRVEEEHLWECKQLGAHSPHVLLSTLMFFNTKHFNLTTVEEHMQLSFSHIMKHWKRSAQNAKSPGTRNVLLRFYPPQAGLDANPRKKKVYEQQENEENPLRCPVRLYEFYLSKCPESVKTRNDVFYLQPERSCVPDSPVWYSTQALSQEALQKMLHRVKMVKEINIALLTS